MDFTQNGQQPFDQGISIELPELDTGLADVELNSIIDGRLAESNTAYQAMKLEERRKKNYEFWIGEHYDPTTMLGLPYVDPVVHRNCEQRIKMATGRMPDIVLTPGDGSLRGRERVKKLENVLDIDISNKEKKRIMKNGLRHNHLFFIGALKACWNPSKGLNGDYEFKLVDPRKLVLAHNGTIPEDGYTADNIDLIAETVEEPLAVVLAKFPNKRQELIGNFFTPVMGGRLPSTIKYQEIWYTYHKNGQIVEGVCWRYMHTIMRNMRNPYFDFTGQQKVEFKDGIPVINQFGQASTKQYFRNFFERPRKPYILFSYQNLGFGPMDTTTAVEQAIPLQANLNKIGKQIRDISDGITNKYAFAGGHIEQGEARRMTANPKEPLWVADVQNINEAVTSFRNDGPPVTLFNEMVQTRQEIDALFQTQNVSRGASGAAESGISKQITREGDLVTSDDLSELVVERVTEEMAGWAIQFMKLMYVEPHFKSKMGSDGESIQEMIQRDDIDDGVALNCRTSLVDKTTARNLAVELGSTGAIDPLTMFEEMDVPNPKERATRLMLFKLGEGETGDGFARYAEAAGLEGIAPKEQPEQPAQPEQPVQPSMPEAPQMPMQPQAPSAPPQAPGEDQEMLAALAAKL